jgi:hypothetical protein
MKSKRVWAEFFTGSEAIGESIPASPAWVVRIFRNQKAALASKSMDVWQVSREWAVGHIRHQIFLRSKGYCEICGAMTIEKSAHMHEQNHRGKGGEISMDNSVMVCVICHKSAHSDREPKFTRRQS